MIGYAILFGGLTTKNNESNYNESFSSTPAAPVVKDLSICGKNDCQNPNVTDENGERYQPASMTLIYILVGVMGGLVVTAMIIHKFVTKPIDTSLEIKDVDEEKREKIEEEKVKISNKLSGGHCQDFDSEVGTSNKLCQTWKKMQAQIIKAQLKQ